jgi:hypothetical protein
MAIVRYRIRTVFDSDSRCTSGEFSIIYNSALRPGYPTNIGRANPGFLYSVGVNVVKFACAFYIIYFEIFPTMSQICTAEPVENRFIESAATETRLDHLWSRLAENAYFD